MSNNKAKLPDNFMWGGSSVPCQIEGAYLEDGKGLAIEDCFGVGFAERFGPDIYLKDPKPDKFYPSHKAIDFYHRYEEDIALMKELGINSFRMGIAWTRFYPTGEEEEPNPKAFEYYDKVIDKLLEAGIEPIISIAGGIPMEIARKHKGFASRITIDLYVKFAKTLFEHYKGKITHWLTHGEYNVVSYMPQMSAGFELDRDNVDFQMLYQGIHNMAVAAAKVMNIAHEIDPNNKIGFGISARQVYPATCKPEDILECVLNKRENIWLFTDVLARGYYPEYTLNFFDELGVKLDITEDDKKEIAACHPDMIGITYYMTNLVKANEEGHAIGNFSWGLPNPYLKETGWGWPIDPLGLTSYLIELYDRYHLPIVIEEIGLGDKDVLIKDENGNYTVDDDYRIDYHRQHIETLKLAFKYGVDVMAYCIWTITDVASMSTGEMAKRYGLVYVDQDDYGNGTNNRYKKKSFEWFKKVIASNGEDLD
ncbi:MAG: glycoside hydrolase family 1 protein [Erysipelotrichaceae bacterium]|nr:glycoside hydrolase family 1 protein [Erysipelotrichaceae bacterium]